MLPLTGIFLARRALSRVLVLTVLMCACGAAAAEASPHAARPTTRTATRTYRDRASRRAARLRQVLRFGQNRNLCSSRLTLRALERQQAQQAGPVARRSTEADALAPTPTRFARGHSINVTDEDAAIQNDAPAAHIDCNENVTPALRSLGVLANAYERQPALGALSLRSSRGPPEMV
jgi:hypothetical protein